MALHSGRKNQMEKLPECVYIGLRAWKDVDYVRNVRKSKCSLMSRSCNFISKVTLTCISQYYSFKLCVFLSFILSVYCFTSAFSSAIEFDITDLVKVVLLATVQFAFWLVGLPCNLAGSIKGDFCIVSSHCSKLELLDKFTASSLSLGSNVSYSRTSKLCLSSLF